MDLGGFAFGNGCAKDGESSSQCSGGYSALECWDWAAVWWGAVLCGMNWQVLSMQQFTSNQRRRSEQASSTLHLKIRHIFAMQ